ncbi:MAG: PTS sugar transporter subunit IIA [Elusimicrobiota bacterium]
MDITLRDAARILNVSEATVSRWIEKDGLPAFFINGRCLFNRIDVLEWVNRRKIPDVDLFALSEKINAPPLCDLLQGNIHYGVPGTNARSVMDSVAQLLFPSSAHDRTLAAQALHDRQALGSTGIGDGIAIPHARRPLVFPAARPAVVLCFLDQPIDFKMPDGIPVSVAIAFVSPGVRIHLALLSELSSALHDLKFRSVLRARGAADEIIGRLKEME